MSDRYEIGERSGAMTETLASTRQLQVGEEKYPWRHLPVGKSFFIDFAKEQVKLITIQSNCSRWSKKLNRKFKAIQHGPSGKSAQPSVNGIEVTRLDDPIEQPTGWGEVAKEAKAFTVPKVVVELTKPVENKPNIEPAPMRHAPWQKPDDQQQEPNNQKVIDYNFDNKK